MGESDANASLFDQVIGDMKVMGPLWEDVLMKASKFYTVVKQTAFTGDLFLDSFQKIADAVTNSKGATRDIGVSFTKIVMRHRAVENKLKVFVGILADNFITPLQDSLDEWKKNCNQLEKDHTKDYKRLKEELKKSVIDTCKLKKKVTKKMGNKEYTEQFRVAVKLSTSLQKSLEEQEKAYLRKVMVEERTHATRFFHYYKPCMEQQLALIADIEQLQSILDETTTQCESPYLPSIYEDLVNDFKLPDYLNFSGRKECNDSPPTSPYNARVRHDSLSCTPTRTKIPLRRSLTTNSFNRKGLDPIPVSMPVSPCHKMVSSSSFSFPSSVDQSSDPIYDTVTTDDFEIENNCSPPFNSCATSESYMKRQINNQGSQRPIKSDTSGSSIRSSDSPGIDSYNFINTYNRSSNLSGLQLRNCSASESDPIETDMNVDYQNIDMLRFGITGFHQPGVTNGSHSSKYATIDRSHFRQSKTQNGATGESKAKQRSNSVKLGEHTSTPHGHKVNLQNGQKNYKTTDDLTLHMQNYNKNAGEHKYATINQSHLGRNQVQIAATLKELELKQKSNDIDNGVIDDTYPNFPDYKMNLPKSKAYSLGRQHMYTSVKKPTIFQVFEGQNIGQSVSSVLKQLSPTSAPRKQLQNYSGQKVCISAPLKQSQIVTPAINAVISSPKHERQMSLPENHSSSQHLSQHLNETCYSSEEKTNNQSSERPLTKPKPQTHFLMQRSYSCGPNYYRPKAHTEFNEPEPAKPGSFEAALQERRNSVLKKTLP